MFDLAEAFAATYNPKSGLYARKDHLLNLVPPHLKSLREDISKLAQNKKYPAKLIVKILTDGYPDCPCCGKPITSPNLSGNLRDEFTKTCGREKCLRWYLSKGSDFGKALQTKAKAGFAKLLKPYIKVVKEKDFTFVVECTRCERQNERNLANASRDCTCSKGAKVRDTRAANQAEAKKERLQELRAYLPVEVKITNVYAKQSKVDLHCSACDTTQTKWLCDAIKWKCGCGKRDRLQVQWNKTKEDTKVRTKKYLKSLGLTWLGVTPNGDHKVRCKCGTEFVPNQPRYLKYGCISCAAKATSPARRIASKATMLERYGVENASQYGPFHRKAMESGYRTKPYTLGDRVVNLRGYEPQAIDYLLAKGIKVRHITAGEKGIPSVRYRYQGENKVYFPDILLRARGKRDMLIEVKSTWTITLDTKKILAKKRAAEKAGYAFQIMVMTPDGKRLDTKKELRRCKKLLKAKS